MIKREEYGHDEQKDEDETVDRLVKVVLAKWFANHLHLSLPPLQAQMITVECCMRFINKNWYEMGLFYSRLAIIALQNRLKTAKEIYQESNPKGLVVPRLSLQNILWNLKLRPLKAPEEMGSLYEDKNNLICA